MNQIFIDFISNTHTQHNKHVRKASFGANEKRTFVEVKKKLINLTKICIV